MEEIRLSRIVAACLEYTVFVASVAIILALAGALIVRTVPDLELHWHAASLATIVLAGIYRSVALVRDALGTEGKAE